MVILDKIAVVGFPKSGTMSLVEYLKKKNPDAEISRPENIYVDLRGFHVKENWSEWECVAITRDPVMRIQSGIRYWPQVKKRYDEEGIEGVLKGFKNYQNVGFKNPIEQSNYDKYIEKFQKNKGVNVKVYRFEDMIKDKDFPHINESPDSIFRLTKNDRNTIQERLDKAGISY